MEDYRSKVFKFLPSLKYLDEQDAEENEEEDDSDGEKNGTIVYSYHNTKNTQIIRASQFKS